jgi:hypothetical protein
MYLSVLQKYILRQCYFKKRCFKKKLIDFYQNKKIRPKKIQGIITRSIERLINKELLIGYGEKTPHKWYIKEIKLTPKGRTVARSLLGKQQRLPLRLKNK